MKSPTTSQRARRIARRVRSEWTRRKAHPDGLWSYRRHARRDPSASLIGLEVEAADGVVGTVIDESTDPEESHIVVDAGFWVFDMVRMIPAGAVDRIDHVRNKVFLPMSSNEIRDAPDFVPEAAGLSERDYRRSLGPYFRPWVETI